MSGSKRRIAAAGGLEQRLGDLWVRFQQAKGPEKRAARRNYERVLAAYSEQQRKEKVRRAASRRKA